MENRSETCFAPVCISLEGGFRPNCKAGRRFPGLTASDGPVPPPPSPWGGGSALCAPFLFHVYWRSFRDRRRALRPSGRPCAPAPPRFAPLHCSSQLPTPPPRTRPEYSPPHPVLYHRPFPLAGGGPPQPPSSCPTLVLPLCVPAPENSLLPLGPRSLELCSAPPCGTGGSGGGGLN